jgi:hypothetical protein
VPPDNLVEANFTRVTGGVWAFPVKNVLPQGKSGYRHDIEQTKGDTAFPLNLMNGMDFHAALL